MADAGILAPTIMGLFQKLAIITSTLHPPTHWSDYTLTECIVLDKNIPTESMFSDRHFVKDGHPVRVFDVDIETPQGIVDVAQGPMASILRNAFEEKIQNFEQAARQKLFQTYQRSVTPVDHASIVIVYNTIKNFWGWFEPKIHMHLQNSRFFGYIDNFQYEEAVDFSAFHANEALYNAIAFRYAALDGRQYIVDEKRINFFKDQFKLKYQQFRPWYERFLKTRQFSNVLHYLYELYGYHDDRLQLARKKIDELRALRESVPPALAENAFMHACKVAQYHQEIVENTVSHHNSLMITRQPSWINWSLEKAIDYTGGLLLNTKQPRDLDELCDRAHRAYEDLCHAEIQSPKEYLTFEEKIEKYKEYIERDNFARTYLLFAETKVSEVDEPSINWERQQRYFENYRRLTGCTIYTLSLMEQAIPALMATIAQLFDSSFLNNKTKKQTDKLCNTLANIHQHMRYLQDHRYLLKLSFIKFIQTSVSKETTDYYSRMQGTILNKLKRVVVTGNVFETVAKFTDQQQACVEGINHVYYFLDRAKEKLSHFNISDAVVRHYMTILPDQSPTLIPAFMILPLKDRAFTKSVKSLTSIDAKEITTDEIRTLKIQCEQKKEDATEGGDRAYWKSQGETLDQFGEILEKITAEKKRILKYKRALKKHQSLKIDAFNQELIGIDGELCALENALKASLRKQTLTEKNEHEGVSFSRLVNSVGRKIDRFCNQGVFVDQRVPLKDVADDYLKQCKDFKSSLDTLRDSINTEITFLREKSVFKKCSSMSSQSTPNLEEKKSAASSSATATKMASSKPASVPARVVQKASLKPAGEKDWESKEQGMKKPATPQRPSAVVGPKKPVVVKKSVVERDNKLGTDDDTLSETASVASVDTDEESEIESDSDDEK